METYRPARAPAHLKLRFTRGASPYLHFRGGEPGIRRLEAKCLKHALTHSHMHTHTWALTHARARTHMRSHAPARIRNHPEERSTQQLRPITNPLRCKPENTMLHKSFRQLPSTCAGRWPAGLTEQRRPGATGRDDLRLKAARSGRQLQRAHSCSVPHGVCVINFPQRAHRSRVPGRRTSSWKREEPLRAHLLLTESFSSQSVCCGQDKILNLSLPASEMWQSIKTC